MTVQHDFLPVRESYPGDVGYLHHVGLVASDTGAAIELYRRLGFLVSPPAYPTMSPTAGAPPEPFGVANTHIAFARNFIELVTPVTGNGIDRIPADAQYLALHAPPELLPSLREAISRTAANLSVCLARFPGLHILMFQTPDAAAVAARLDIQGVRHSPLNAVQRPVDTTGGTRMEPIRYVELDSDDPHAASGQLAEGRIGIAENPPPSVLRAQLFTDHPNGAVDLVEAMICIGADEHREAVERYERFLGRPARHTGPTHVFDFDGAQLALVADTNLDEILPGETAPALPAIVAFAVKVRELDAARQLIQRNHIPTAASTSGGFFVPATAALGGVIIFRPPQ
jgi:Glyoxalase-like domain